jgi:hypothetical protein
MLGGELRRQGSQDKKEGMRQQAQASDAKGSLNLPLLYRG